MVWGSDDCGKKPIVSICHPAFFKHKLNIECKAENTLDTILQKKRYYTVYTVIAECMG
jgi:hypothetical protein